MENIAFAYCSWCYQHSHHALLEKNWVRRDRYVCAHCERDTYACRWYQCQHMARGGPGWDDERCAEHTHEIPSFRQLDQKLTSIALAKNLFARDSAMPVKRILRSVSTPLSDLVFNDVESFSIDTVQEGSTCRALVFVNGFLSKSNGTNADWAKHLPHSNHGRDSWYRLNWDTGDWTELVTSAMAGTALGMVAGAVAGAKTDTRGASAALVTGAALGIVAGSATQWFAAMTKAETTGRLLAQVIHRTPGWTFTLIGHSLGARAIHYALTTLALVAPKEKRIQRAILLGGAVDRDCQQDWVLARKAVMDGGTIDNGLSNQDETLRKLYQSSMAAQSKPIGLGPIERVRGVRNFDCSDLISGHDQWKPRLDAVLERMNA
jgi:pimeloyl-ACP methyl ester carboxylesterase